MDQNGARDLVGKAQDAFHAHYPCLPDDVSIQKPHGELWHMIVKKAWPDLCTPLRVPAKDTQGCIRVGFVSSMFRDHTVGRLHAGWIKNLDRKKISVHLWQLREKDRETEELASFCDSFTFEFDPARREQVARQIRRANLHALIYPEVGMDQLILSLAAMRLAPPWSRGTDKGELWHSRR